MFLIKKNLVIPPKKTQAIFGGVLSGFSAGLLGSGGAIRGITMGAFNLEKSTFIATSAFIDLGVDLSRSIVYFSNGYIHSHDLYLIPWLLGCSVIGTFIGKKILEKISEEKFKSIVLLLIFITGIITLVKITGY